MKKKHVCIFIFSLLLSSSVLLCDKKGDDCSAEDNYCECIHPGETTEPFELKSAKSFSFSADRNYIDALDFDPAQTPIRQSLLMDMGLITGPTEPCGGHGCGCCPYCSRQGQE